MKKFSLFPLSAYFFSSCGKKTESTTPVIEKITESVYASGIIKSRNQYQVYSTVTGLLQEIYVQEGDSVNMNDSILRIQNISSDLNRANAKLAADLAGFNANGDKLNELKVNIEFASSKMKNDSAMFARQQSLWSQQIGTKNELEQRELAFKNSVANYRAALYRLNDAKKQLETNALQALNNLEISNSQAGDFILKSKYKGRVYSILKEKGELVSPQSPIAVIGDASDFEIQLLVDEYDITRVKPGQKVMISLDSYKGKVYEATVSKIDPIMNERTRTFRITAEFILKPEVLYPNLTAEANIIIQSKEKALLIPRNFLIGDSLIINEKKEKVRVKTGLMDYNKAEILSGISVGEKIIKP